MRACDKLIRHLSTHVLCQENAIREISLKVESALEAIPSSMNIDENEGNRPFTMLFSGPSGLGKTLTVKKLRSYFQMGVNQPNECAYIEYRFTNVDSSKPDFLTIGKREDKTPTLYSHLIEAITHYIRKNPKPQNECHIILILFDEIDKAPPNTMNKLNSLLSDGCYMNDCNRCIYVPSCIRLVICFTANFGADYMFTAKKNVVDCDYDETKAIIRNEILSRGYAQCDVSRLGSILPFLPIVTENDWLFLLEKRVRHNIKKDKFATRFGPSDISPEDMEAFNRSLLESYVYKGNESICDAYRYVDDVMGEFSVNNLHRYVKALDGLNVGRFLEPKARYFFGSVAFDENLANKLNDVISDDPLLKIAIKDPGNSRKMKKRWGSKSAIDYMALKHPLVKEPSINVINPPVVNVNITNIQNMNVINDKNTHHNDDAVNYLTCLVKNEMQTRDKLKNEISSIVESFLGKESCDLDDAVKTMNQIKGIVTIEKGSSSSSSSSSSLSTVKRLGNSEDTEDIIVTDKKRKKKKKKKDAKHGYNTDHTKTIIVNDKNDEETNHTHDDRTKTSVTDSTVNEKKRKVDELTRICNYCEEEYSMDHFYVMSKGKQSTLRKCKKCRSNYVISRKKKRV
jgi:hypothetical protein